jgi:hypothetical protein
LENLNLSYARTSGSLPRRRYIFRGRVEVSWTRFLIEMKNEEKTAEAKKRETAWVS